ncbi:hypothetical protein ACTI_67820 [Actinoplanes sp. OR16]|uniref:hypothetical protein n=1 Tax=Actinoplanes sp. OR16 TaxID=946334 RepID=UPI000F71D1D3|nr:hypothetical protein [Actinoplanes sp. OR16]BBH70097.1 hypothetical protein ACTI_67820 [Actinoplanes sp. OR16]
MSSLWLSSDAARVIADLVRQAGGGEVILSEREDVLLIEVVHQHREPIAVGAPDGALTCGSHATSTGGVLWAEIRSTPGGVIR